VERAEVRARVERYVESVLTGELISCRTVMRAVERFRDDLENPDLFVDWEELNNFDKFARQFKHYKGRLSGQPFEMEDWQLFTAVNVLCVKWRATGRRKYRYVDILVPRKNGKTFFVAVLALWLLLFDGESGPEVYSAAVDQAQARLCYDVAETLVKRSIFAPMVKVYNWGMKVPQSVGVFKPLSKSTDNKDGLNISAAICDEVHAWPNTEMTDVIKTGTGARMQPVILRISTAGTSVAAPYYQDVQAYVDELEGVLPLESDHFFMLYLPDPDDDWEDEEVWRKLNPNLGVSLEWAYMRSVYEEAKTRGGSYAAAFKTKDLNMWVDAPEVWISDEDVTANAGALDRAQLAGLPCYVGIDMASKTDIVAVAFWFPGRRAAFWRYYVPEEKVREKGDRVDYRLWAEKGWLTVVPGKVIDEDWFVSDLLRQLDPYDVRAIAYDPWGMWNILGKFGRYQDRLMEYRQDIRYMSVPTKWVQSEVLRHRLNFGDDPVIRWMFRNVVVYIDPNANVKLDKARSRNKIDGVVALVDAVGSWLNKTAEQKGPAYEDHELRVLPSRYGN